MTTKPGIISEEASEWDQMTLDRKLLVLTRRIDAAIFWAGVEDERGKELNRCLNRLEELSSYVHQVMRDRGITI